MQNKKDFKQTSVDRFIKKFNFATMLAFASLEFIVFITLCFILQNFLNMIHDAYFCFYVAMIFLGFGSFIVVNKIIFEFIKMKKENK